MGGFGLVARQRDGGEGYWIVLLGWPWWGVGVDGEGGRMEGEAFAI